MITEGATTPPPAPKPAGTTPAPANGATSTTQPPIPSDAERKAREAEIKKRGAALKAEKDALNKDRAAIIAEQKALAAEKAEVSEWKRWKASALTDHESFLKPIYGDNWRETLQRVEAGDKTPLAVRQVQDQMRQLEKAKADDDARKAKDAQDAEQKAKQDQAAAEEQSFQEYRTDTNKRFGKGGEFEDKFPTLARSGLGYEVAVRIRALHQKGELPEDVDAKEQEIAATLEAELDTLLDGVLSHKKWEEKLASKFRPSAPVPKPDALPFQVTRRSISQDMVPGTKPAAKPLTREERKEAIRKMTTAELEQKANQYRGLRVEAEE